MTPSAVLRELTTRHSSRIWEHADEEALLSHGGWRGGYLLAGIDIVLGRLKVPWHPDEVGDSPNEIWLWTLRDAADTYARICWHLRFGHTMAAVAMTRWYLERWTFNVASSHGVSREAGEEYEPYLKRVWSVYGDTMDPEAVASSWAMLSELLHGRSVRLQNATVSVSLMSPATEKQRIHLLIARTAEVALRQVRFCVYGYVSEHGLVQPEDERLLKAMHHTLPRAVPEQDFLRALFEPLLHEFVFSERSDHYVGWGETYRKITSHRVPTADWPFTIDSWMALEERWTRAIEVARRAFSHEQASMPGFDPAILQGAILRYIAISELADMLAEGLPREERAALKAAASALESAWVLWLQDVDDSLICVRTALESTARARAHRKSPRRASRLEDRGAKTTPHRWVEGAGWRRLSAFTRALGEFSHIQDHSRRMKARELLKTIQRDAVDGTEVHTARVSALLEVSKMMGLEVVERLELLAPDLATVFRTLVLSDDDPALEIEIEAWLDRGLEYKGFEFGPPDLKTLV